MLNLLRSERGIALPLALLVMLVLSISVIAIVDYTGGNARNASLTKERQNARGLAEDGFNRAASILHELVEANEADPGSVDLPSGSVPAADLPSGRSISWEQVQKTGTGHLTQWTIRATATVPNPTAPSAAPITKWIQGTLYLSVENTHSEIPWRGVVAAEQGNRPLLSDDNALIDTPLYVKEGYSSYSASGVGTGPIPVQISGGKIMNDDFRVYGRLAVTGSADVASIGASARPGLSWKSSFPPPAIRTEFRVPSFRVKDGCATSTTGPFLASTCKQTSSTGGPTQRFWLPCPGGTCTTTTVDSPVFSTEVPNVEKPPVDFPARYAAIKPGSTTDRLHRCYASSKANLEQMNAKIGEDWSNTRPGNGFSGSSRKMDDDTTRNRSIGTVNLMPSAAYDCRLVLADGTEIGRITWQPSADANQPGTLTINGDVYFDGDITLGDSTTSTSTHGWGRVVGKGVMHVTGILVMKGTNGGICGVADTAANRLTHSVPGSPSGRGRCLNGKVGDTVPPAQPPIEAPEIWDPGTTDDLISFVVGFSPSIETINVQNDFQFQGSLYAGCTRNAASGTDSVCPTLSTPPRSGLVVQNQATVKGPVIVDSVEVKNNGVIAGWTPLNDLNDIGVDSGTTIKLTLLPGSWRG